MPSVCSLRRSFLKSFVPSTYFYGLQGSVYDYYVDEQSCSMVHWEARVTPFVYQPGNFASIFVPTVESTRVSFLLELLMSRSHYVMLVGNTGSCLTAQRIH